MKGTLIAIILILGLAACKIEPVAIDYDKDQCAYCKMIISDQKFGTELITSKGRITKYDAIECMAAVVREKGMQSFRHILVTDIQQPGLLTPAESAFFLKHPKIPSPMGGNLSAYTSKNVALSLNEDKLGSVLSWTELINRK